jgi:hypothetical protein
MKPMILSLLVVLALTTTGALLAQSSVNDGATAGSGTSTSSSYGSSGPGGAAGAGNSAGTTGTMISNHSDHLPRTASKLPLVVAFGLLVLSAGFIVRSSR